MALSTVFHSINSPDNSLLSYSVLPGLFLPYWSFQQFHHRHHQSLNREGRLGTTDDFTTSFLYFSLFSTALWDLANSRPVYSLMLSCHLFLCLPCLLPPFTVSCKMVFARPDERETWPSHCSLRLFMIVRRSSCGPIACWILARTSSAKTNLTYFTVNLWQKQNKQNVGVFWGKTSTKQDVRFCFFLRFFSPPNIKGQTMSGWDGKSDE